MENWIFRDLSGLKIGRRKRRRTTVRGREERETFLESERIARIEIDDATLRTTMRIPTTTI